MWGLVPIIIVAACGAAYCHTVGDEIGKGTNLVTGLAAIACLLAVYAATQP